MKKKLCKWAYNHGLVRLAYWISPAHFIVLCGGDIMRGLLDGLESDRK